MIARRDVPLWFMLARLKLDVLRYRARRAVLRLMRRVLDWMEPTG